MTQVILQTRLKNAIKRHNKVIDLEYELTNHKNYYQQYEGCSGFITNKATGVCVYIDTRNPQMRLDQVMYRVADNNRDYTGYMNNWCKNDVDILATTLIHLLKMDKSALERTYARSRV